ncbi:MAG: DUF3365 domain-containing protein [Zoogloeaceae bacterium]|nr:DUF3365 domain-containing protein [Zoogloeaceae bacterium]
MWTRSALSLMAGLGLASATLAADDLANLTADARDVTGQLLRQISGELKREYQLSGSLRSVVVCKYTAPEVSSALSRKNGVVVKRVSLRVRNPSLGSPDPWEQKVLEAFDRRRAAGESGEQIEFGEIVQEPVGRYYRYMKAIPMAEFCVACHGTREAISPATLAQIASEYPHDQAIGYAVGELRGAVTYKKPL